MGLSTPVGSNRTAPAMPSSSSGAASPMARDSPRMVPVAMPGIEDGRVCRHVVCQSVAPSAREPNRISFGTARTASRVVMMMIGRISSARAIAPPSTMPLRSKPSSAMTATASRP